MNQISFTCSNNHPFKVPAKFAGKRAKCPKCGEVVSIPHSSTVESIPSKLVPKVEGDRPITRQDVIFIGKIFFGILTSALLIGALVSIDNPVTQFLNDSGVTQFFKDNAEKSRQASEAEQRARWSAAQQANHRRFHEPKNDEQEASVSFAGYPGPWYFHVFVRLPVMLLLVISIAIYFLPSWVAYEKNKKQKAAIFCLNCFLGATGIGWVGAMVWATMED